MNYFLMHQAELHHVEKNSLDCEPQFGIWMLNCRYSELLSWHPLMTKSLAAANPDLFIRFVILYPQELLCIPFCSHEQNCWALCCFYYSAQSWLLVISCFWSLRGVGLLMKVMVSYLVRESHKVTTALWSGYILDWCNIYLGTNLMVMYNLSLHLLWSSLHIATISNDGSRLSSFPCNACILVHVVPWRTIQAGGQHIKKSLSAHWQFLSG